MSAATSWTNKMQLAKCDIMVSFCKSNHIYPVYNLKYETYLRTKKYNRKFIIYICIIMYPFYPSVGRLKEKWDYIFIC